MTAARISDHEQKAKDRLICALKQSATVNDLLGALVQEIQEVEDVFIDRQTQLRLEDAEGAQLDGIGATLNVPRNALDDVTYRQRIQAQILINTVSGTRPEIIEVLNTLIRFTSSYLDLTQAQRDALTTQVIVRDYFPKSSIVAFSGLGFSAEDLAALGKSLRDVAPLGTRVELTAPIVGFADATFKFSDVATAPTLSSTRGFDEGEFVSLAIDDIYSIIDILLDTLPETWTAQTAAGAYAGPFRGVTYGAGRYLATGDGELQTSDDKGATWTARTIDAGYAFGVTMAAYGGGNFLIGGSAMLQTSPDGETWTSRTLDGGYSGFIQGAAYNGSRWVIVGNSGEIQTSDDDGATWTSRTSGTANALQDVVWNNGTFVAVGVSATILTSPDGETWTARTPDGGYVGSFYGITVGPVEVGMTTLDIYCIVGSLGEIQVSADDGASWVARTADGGFSDFFYDVAYGGNGIYVAVGAGGEIQVSQGSTFWDAESADGGFASNFLDVVNGPTNHWIAVGAGGEIQTSGA